ERVRPLQPRYPRIEQARAAAGGLLHIEPPLVLHQRKGQMVRRVDGCAEIDGRPAARSRVREIDFLAERPVGRNLRNGPRWAELDDVPELAAADRARTGEGIVVNVP